MLSFKEIKRWPKEWLIHLDNYRWYRAWSRLTAGLHSSDIPPEVDPFAEWQDEGTPVG